jgi:signal transduction histidine kinase
MLQNQRERLEIIGEMAAEMAHELRNALQTIASSAHVGRIAVACGNAAEAEPHLATIERNTVFAHAIVDDVMSLARGEPIDAQLVRLVDVIAAARSEGDLGPARWNDDDVAPALVVRAQPRLLARLLHAVYDNAIRASAPREPTVTTRAWSRGDRVIVDVADDGPGVAPAIKPRIFEPLVTARDEGTGLGLALARRIALAHGGSIELASSDAHGATFRIELPGRE